MNPNFSNGLLDRNNHDSHDSVYIDFQVLKAGVAQVMFWVSPLCSIIHLHGD